MNAHLVGILADTHDNRTAIQKAVALFNQRGTGLVIHAGDMISPFCILDFRALACPMQLVFGNNDGEKIGLHAAFQSKGTIQNGPRIFTYEGKRFLLMHEDQCVDSLQDLNAVDVVVYGHTHEVDVRPGPPLIINPGEAGGWLKGRSTVALLDLNTMQAGIMDLA
jgi:putative phosphoesterase